ncbi:protein kinase [Strigomonas culicis]|uniref:Protein kinase n=1 Tax=Strigomonas culicis TaxID=28005 RepID=S9UYF9_9TRYP|nr:protein kinase [Strigomonas culicis]EPY33508.1 protein kinase [Strigomonas culicis]|eukprot:EPY19606.1 protein kinase [Strigomonas culicis]
MSSVSTGVYDNLPTDEELNIHIKPEDPQEVFEELESAGTGNFGVVIKARVRHTGDIVAIKQILLADKEELVTIVKEVIILEKCDHPNIVRYYGTYKSFGKLWLVMEYCEGGSVDVLYKILHRPLPEQVIAYICREVLLGLQYMHREHRLHRDIKGSNILLTRDGQVKLADFGVSTELGHSWSRRNTFIGTLLWMAPETILESDYDSRADIWSLGITVIEIAENGPPNLGVSIARLVFLIPKSDPPTLQHKERWSPQMSNFIKRLLTKDKKIRPTATQMLEDPFVAPENIAPREEMKLLIDEALERKENMSSSRVRRGEFSDASTATFVEKSSTSSRGSFEGRGEGQAKEVLAGVDGDAVSAAPDTEPSFFTDGTIPLLPLLSAVDIKFDELSMSEARQKPMPVEQVVHDAG